MAENIIKPGDEILAMISRNGKVIAQVRESEYASTSQLISALNDMGADNPGLCKLFIRNFTRGWHLSKMLFINKKQEPQNSYDKYGQYSFAF